MASPSTIGSNPIAVGRQTTLAQAGWIASFACLTAVGAQIEIPHYPVPYTLQTFIVLLAGAMLGVRNGTLSQLGYLAVGAIGLPVFSGFGFGFARLVGPTGGYLLAFPIAAFVIGYLIGKSRRFWWVMLSMTIGSLVIFSLGTLQLYFVYYRDWALAFTNGFLIFSWWDVVKIAAAGSIYVAASRKTG